MSTDITQNNQHFAKLAENIESFIAQSDTQTTDLHHLELWLKNHLERIRIKRLSSESSVFDPHKQENDRYDGIIIFDQNLKVLQFVAPRNYFYGPKFSDATSLDMSDFLFEDDLVMLNEVLSSAENLTLNSTYELTFKSGPGSSIKGLMTLKSSCNELQEKNFTALLRFPEIHEQLFTTYQAIILDNLPGMDVYLFDRNYRFIIAGGREKERHGNANDYFVGKTFFEVLDKKSRRSLFPFYNKALNGLHTEGEVRFNDQVYYIVAKPIYENDREPVAGLLIAQNVTSDKLLEQQLRKRKEEAQRADQAKSIFIANLSHEIRTPLNAIVGFIEQLGKTGLDQQQLDLLTIIQKASDHLLYLVNEVVFLFKLGMGKIYIEHIPFSVNDLLEEINSLMAPKAAEKNLELSILSDNCPLIVTGDPYRVKQILMNLLANAIKFSDKGEIKLSCLHKRNKKNMVEVTFKVSDNGPGIAKEDLPNIFNVFEQGAVLNQHSKSGAGLGLGICQRLTTLLDGEISVKSKINHGSEFKVKLPFEIFTGDLKVREVNKFAIEDDLLAGKSILLADDDEHNLMLGEMILKSWGVKYTLVTNGCDVITSASNTLFDILLLDIQMPCKNGIDVIKTIRSTPDHLNKSTPAISISANILKSDIVKYLKAGFNDYITKPYKEEELYNKLCSVLFLQKNEPLPAPVNKKPEISQKIDLSELRRTARGDEMFVKKMVQNFIDQAENLLGVFKQPTDDKNWNFVGEKAHKAIPAFSYFKLNFVVESLKIIENNTLRKYNPDVAALEIGRAVKNIRQTIRQARKILSEM
jgi:signal transduction histidine kinase/DNA-binding response OmpR family regulator